MCTRCNVIALTHSEVRRAVDLRVGHALSDTREKHVRRKHHDPSVVVVHSAIVHEVLGRIQANSIATRKHNASVAVASHLRCLDAAPTTTRHVDAHHAMIRHSARLQYDVFGVVDFDT